jgi:arginyl-tRNA--protein-N-Asp/Glu arginylyltransferase
VLIRPCAFDPEHFDLFCRYQHARHKVDPGFKTKI